MYGHVPHAVIEIVSGREDIVVDGSYRLGRHIGSGKFARRLALPVLVRLRDLAFCVFGNIERVGGTRRYRVEFRFQPFIGKLGIGLTPARRQRRTAHDQFLVADDDWNVLQDMQKRLRTPGDHRFALRHAVGFGDQSRTRGFDFGHFFEEIVFQPRDSVSHRYRFRIILSHNTSLPLFFIRFYYTIHCFACQ